MYCPSCGQENSTEQKFCRKCGLNLEKSAASLIEQRPDGGFEGTDRRLEMFGNIAFGGLILVGLAAVTGMIYTVVTKFILTGQGIVFGVIISLLLIFAVLGLAYVVLNESRKSNRPATNDSDEKPLAFEKPDTGKLLDTGGFEPIPSVIEDTTDLLKVEAKTRKL